MCKASNAGKPGTCADKSQSVFMDTSERPVGNQPSAWRRFSPATPLISLACWSKLSKLPYSMSHLAAVLGPTLATPGTLSTVSPTKVW